MFLNYHHADEIPHSDFLLPDLLHLISLDQNLSKVEEIHIWQLEPNAFAEQ